MSESWVVTRRRFVATSTAASLAAMAPGWRRAFADKRVTMALLGAGDRGTSWIPHTHAIGLELRAIVDPDTDAISGAMRTAIAHGLIPAQHADDEAVLQDTEIQAVLVAAPLHVAGPLVRRACLAGKDVYLDRESCGDASTVDALLRTLEISGRAVQIGLPGMSHRETRAAITALQRGNLGAMRGATLDIANGLPMHQALPDDIANELAIVMAGLGVRSPMEIRSRFGAASATRSRSCWCRFAEGPVLEIRRRGTDDPACTQTTLTFVGDAGTSTIAAAGRDVVERYGAAARPTHLQNFADYLRDGHVALHAEFRQMALAGLLLREIQDVLTA